jgi:hypothetical protein
VTQIDYNSAEGVFLTLTRQTPLKTVIDHLWYNSGTNFVGSISAITLRDTKSARTIRTFKHLPLGSRHWLPSNAHFILAGSWLELSYLASRLITRPDQLSDRHAFNMTKEMLQNRSLIDTDRDIFTPKTSMPYCFTIVISPGLILAY